MPAVAKKPARKKVSSRPTPKKRSADVKVKLLAHDGKIVFIPESHRETSKFVPTDDKGRLGTVMLDTKKNLSISKEAMKLLQQIKPGVDAIGDVSWWECDDKEFAFSWFAAIYSVKDPKDCVGDRDWRPSKDFPHTEIPNDVPQEVIDGIKAMKKHGVEHLWKDPFGVGYPTIAVLAEREKRAKSKGLAQRPPKKGGKKKPSKKAKAKKK